MCIRDRYFTESMIEDLQRQVSEAARDAKHSLASFVKSTLGEAAGAVEIRVVEGSPVDAIQKMAADVHADLIDWSEPVDARFGGGTGPQAKPSPGSHGAQRSARRDQEYSHAAERQ